jgi:hypothetical protein
MKDHLKRYPYFSLTCPLLLLTATCILSVAATKKQEMPQLPRIVSRVRNLEVVNATIRGSMIAIEIRNNSERPVIAIAVEFRDDVNAAGVTHNGFNDGNELPSVIIAPYGIITVGIPLSYANHVREGSPIRIGGVMYADDSTEGDETSLETLRGQREYYRSRRGQSPQQ